jgi:hypothetical protein
MSGNGVDITAVCQLLPEVADRVGSRRLTVNFPKFAPTSGNYPGR